MMFDLIVGECWLFGIPKQMSLALQKSNLKMGHKISLKFEFVKLPHCLTFQNL
jgi:hypothetical protein